MQVRLVAQSVVIGNELYVIGGWDPGHVQDGGEILSDVWILDLTTYQWRELKPQVSMQEHASHATLNRLDSAICGIAAGNLHM